MIYSDLQIDTTDLDLTTIEEQNNESLIINSILQEARIEVDTLQGYKLNEKKGFIGDILKDKDYRCGTQLLRYGRDERNVKLFNSLSKIEIESALNRLKKTKIIGEFNIDSITLLAGYLSVELSIDNKKITINSSING